MLSLRLSIAFIPAGVAALPKPKILETTFIEILSIASLLYLASGKSHNNIGLNILVSLFIIDVFLTISIIPHQRHIVPTSVIERLITDSIDSKIELFNFSTFPLIIAKIKETIINIGHK